MLLLQFLRHGGAAVLPVAGHHAQWRGGNLRQRRVTRPGFRLRKLQNLRIQSDGQCRAQAVKRLRPRQCDQPVVLLGWSAPVSARTSRSGCRCVWERWNNSDEIVNADALRLGFATGSRGGLSNPWRTFSRDGAPNSDSASGGQFNRETHQVHETVWGHEVN
jgi:hypothetical protein